MYFHLVYEYYQECFNCEINRKLLCFDAILQKLLITWWRLGTVTFCVCQGKDCVRQAVPMLGVRAPTPSTSIFMPPWLARLWSSLRGTSMLLRYVHMYKITNTHIDIDTHTCTTPRVNILVTCTTKNTQHITETLAYTSPHSFHTPWMTGMAFLSRL